MRSAIPLMLVTLLFMAVTVEPAMGETVYKWVDEKGTVHFGSRPPAGVEAVAVRVSPDSPDASAESTEESAASPPPAIAAEPKKTPGQIAREEREKRRAELAEERQQLELQCEAMRQQLAWVEPSPRVLVETEDGDTRRLDDDERLQLLNEARSFIEENCQ